jgi:hypothetical protein
MFRNRHLLNAAAAMATLLALGAAGMAADIAAERLERPQCILGRPQCIVELQPGMTKIVPVRADRPVQAIIIGNPNVADVSVINLRAIAITGKGAGLTNVILFDAEGTEISNSNIQVVGAEAYRGGDYVRERHEVSVISMWGGPGSNKEAIQTRRYLCAQNCGTLEVDEPSALNPPGNTSAATAPTNKSIVTYTNERPVPLEGK